MWQVMAGVSYPMTETLTYDLTYRYLTLPKYKVSGSVGAYSGAAKIDTSLHVLSAGARMKF